MERRRSAQPPLTHTPKLEIEEGKAYLVDDKEQLPYELLRNLGHGHSGNVEEVKDINTGRVFARKTIRIPSGRGGKDRKKIFENEVDIMRSLAGHHHIIRVFATYVSKYEVGQILHPVADEGDLERFLESCCHSIIDCESSDISDIDKARVDILKRSFGCLASGLEFMHERKIRHKDVKPRNVLVHQGSVIYTDFGYSLDSSREGHSTTAGRPDFLTRRYSAPEVVDYEPRNSRSDVFSLGCVFLEVLSTLAKDLVFDSYHYYHESMNSIHTQMIGANLPKSLEFLVEIIIPMTLANPADRSTAADVASKFREYPDFLCGRCQPPNFAQTPLRLTRNMIDPGNSKGDSQINDLDLMTRPMRYGNLPPSPVIEMLHIWNRSSSDVRSTVLSSSRLPEKDDAIEGWYSPLPHKDSLEDVRNRRLRIEERRARRAEERRLAEEGYVEIEWDPYEDARNQVFRKERNSSEKLRLMSEEAARMVREEAEKQRRREELRARRAEEGRAEEERRLAEEEAVRSRKKDIENRKRREERRARRAEEARVAEEVAASKEERRLRHEKRRERREAERLEREKAALASSSDSKVDEQAPQFGDTRDRHTDATTRPPTSISKRHRKTPPKKTDGFFGGLARFLQG